MYQSKNKIPKKEKENCEISSNIPGLAITKLYFIKIMCRISIQINGANGLQKYDKVYIEFSKR